ncbi:MAG TPA: GerMN domain-containing protein [bacterium]|nr:GerMN domain-containing protein [bacterium]HOL49079.1 GerMN domain-containing protein [bacterium]HPO52420.1 GerMN domain-containing protein [bacterium]HXK45129.1 GerMN domain-containing protein [bacterium]
MGTGEMNFQKKIVLGLLILWAILLIVFGLFKAGIFSSKKITVYFFKNQSDGSLTFVEVTRQSKTGLLGSSLEEKIKSAMTELIKGPGSDETTSGYISCVPSEAEILGVKVEDNLIYLDFDENIESGGGISEIRGRLAQIVFTATQFNPDAGVRILIGGKEIKSFSGEGITDVEKPMYRKDFSEFLRGENNEGKNPS